MSGQFTENNYLAGARASAAWDAAHDLAVPGLLGGILEATIALAEEQRTANLIAILTARDESGRAALGMGQLGSAIEQIEQRLGLSTPSEQGQPS